MTPAGSTRVLAPRRRPGRPADVASRAGVIANQRHPARRMRRVRRALRLAGRVLAAALALGAVTVVGRVAAHWLVRTPLLAVTRVDVQGARRLPEALVRTAAGIEPGASILTLDVPAAEAGVAALAGVRRVRLVRHLPHRVALLVEEREPYALVNAAAPAGRPQAEGLYWIDAEGYLVGPEPRPGVPALPILSGVSRPPAGAAGAPSEALQRGLALLRALQRVGGRVVGRVSEIDLAGADGPVLYLTDGAEVRVGGEAWSERLARLDGVLGDLDIHGEHVASVDLRFRDLVVLKPRAAATPGPDARIAAETRRRTTQP